MQTSITMKATETKPHTGTVDANSAQKTAENEVMLGKLDMSAPTLNVVEDSFFTRIQKVTINSYVPKFVLDAGKDQIEKQLKAIAKISGQTQIYGGRTRYTQSSGARRAMEYSQVVD